ncbi:MAG: dienelactone hydrolase family protein [Chloroflexi bacterium]|nr:dienelactone hydrolase family protein [Chloroflexota bacterium]
MNEVQQYLVEEELEHYRDGWINRREFLRRASLLGVASSVAAALSTSVTPARAAPATAQDQTSPFHVPEDDPAVATGWSSYPSDDGAELHAYVAWPATATEGAGFPGIAICHENQGLTAHIQDVARRYALQGYVAIAPDLPSRFGPPTSELSPDEVRATFSRLSPRQNARDFAAALDFIRQDAAVDSTKLAATGYCFGGGVIWELTTIYPDLIAAAPYYGSAPPLVGVSEIRAAVFGVYGELDTRLNASIPDLQAALDTSGKTYSMKIYPNAPHAFHNDTGRAYNRDAAVEAYVDTLNWFAEHLSLAPSPGTVRA